MAKSVALYDKSYKENLINTLYDFRKTEYFTDIVLTFKSKEIHAHRVILAAASEVFAAMFQADMKEKFEGKVDLTSFGLNDNIAEDLVEYIYTGKLCISVENVEDILACANFFMVNSLRDACCQFMENALTSTNCFGIVTIATKFKCDKLQEKAMKVIQEEFAAAVEGEEFLHLNFHEVFDLLSNDMIEVTSEDTVFKSLMRWLEFDLNNRSKYFQKLLECVRIQFLTDAYFSVLNLRHCETLSKEARMAKKCYEETNGFQLLPVGKNIFPRKCLDTSEVIMTTGGYDGNACLLSSFAYSLNENKWKHLAPMHVSRHDHGTVSLQNRLFVVGGFNSHRGPLNSAEFFNSIRNEWEEMPSMNSKRKSLGVCVHQNRLFVSGGLDGNYNSLNTVECYDGEQEVWSMFIPMNQARYSHGFVANENGLFAIGGWKMTTAERFCEGGWHMISPLTVARAGATTIIRQNKIYVYGGYSNSRCISSIEIYDIDLDYWTNGAPSQLSRWRAGSAVVENTMYVIGGRDSSWQYLDAVESYNLETDEWREEEPLPCAIMGLRCSLLKVPKHAMR